MRLLRKAPRAAGAPQDLFTMPQDKILLTGMPKGFLEAAQACVYLRSAVNLGSVPTNTALASYTEIVGALIAKHTLP